MGYGHTLTSFFICDGSSQLYDSTTMASTQKHSEVCWARWLVPGQEILPRRTEKREPQKGEERHAILRSFSLRETKDSPHLPLLVSQKRLDGSCAAVEK